MCVTYECQFRSRVLFLIVPTRHNHSSNSNNGNGFFGCRIQNNLQTIHKGGYNGRDQRPNTRKVRLIEQV